MKKSLLILSLSLIFGAPVLAQDSPVTETLLQTTESWDGSVLPAFPQGSSEITVQKITIPSGFQLPVHKHPNPLAAYVLAGELTAILEEGKSKVFKQGEVITEVVSTWHYGRNEGTEPLVLIAFFIGLKGEPITIAKEI